MADSIRAKHWRIHTHKFRKHGNWRNRNEPKAPKITVLSSHGYFQQQFHCQFMTEVRRCKPKTKYHNMQQWGNSNLQTLINQVIPQPLNNHVTLSRGQRFVIYTKNQSLAGFLHSDTTSTLQNGQQNYKWKKKE